MIVKMIAMIINTIKGGRIMAPQRTYIRVSILQIRQVRAAFTCESCNSFTSSVA